MRQVVQGLQQDPPAPTQVLCIALGQVHQGTDALQPFRRQLQWARKAGTGKAHQQDTPDTLTSTASPEEAPE